MSAWIVTKGHIDCLVQAMIVEGIVPMADATSTGKLLWDENHRSVNCRYDESESTPDYVFEGVEAPLDDLVVWRQLDCYDYQTCEHAEWHDPTNPARALHDRLEAIYRARYGSESSYDVTVVGELPWGIDTIEQAVKAA